MKQLLAMGFVLLGIVGAAQARTSKADKAFIKAVKTDNREVFERLYGVVSQKAYDKALKKVAHYGNLDLFRALEQRASYKGLARGSRSLKRHGYIAPVYSPVCYWCAW